MEKPIKSRSDKILVFAIDIGTHYTGCAFSVKHEWANVRSFTWSSSYTVNIKFPTCLLLEKDDKLCVGYEAQEKYNVMDLNDVVEPHHEYYFFKHFPAVLHEDVCIL